MNSECGTGNAEQGESGIPPAQLTLFRETPEEQFERWIELPGARHVMRDLYALAAGYVWDWKRTGIPVSSKLLVELERHRIKRVTARAQRRFRKMPAWNGYTLNNSFTAAIARHLVRHKPEWAGLFEMRESPRKTGRTWALVVEGKREKAGGK